MLEQAISDFYRVIDGGIVTVYIHGDEYYIGDMDSIPFAQEEVEWAEITTSLPVRYVNV